MAPVRVLLADDQRLVRAGFRVILDGQPDLVVVGEAADGHQAVRLTLDLSPDVVLMDVRMPGLDGLAATEQIVAAGSSAAVLMLTTFDADEYVYGALRAGAHGFLLKDAREEQLIDAVRVAAAGEAMLAPSVTRRLIAEFARGASRRATSTWSGARSRGPALAELTDRERDVVSAVARGRTNTEIAADLVLSLHTVKSHVARSLTKLGLRDRTQLAIVAYESGLIRAGDDEAGFAPESDAGASHGF